MRRNRLGIFDPLWVGGSTALAVAMMANLGWSQLLPPVPAVPDAVQDATNPAQDAVKDAKDVTKDVQKDVSNTAQDAVKDAKNAQRDAASAAQDAVKDAKDTGKDARKDATKAARDATRDARDTAKDATDNAREAARATARESIDARGNVRTDQSVRTQGSVSASANSNFRAADLGIWFDRSTRNGLTIADVVANTALAQVGFREGDRIVSVGGQNITTETDFVRYLLNKNARGRMNVVVLRDGQQQTLFVEPSFLNQRMTTLQVDPLEQFGIILDDRYDDRLTIWRVVPRSPAFYAGIRAGDVITTFANQPVTDRKAFAQLALQTKAGTIPIQVSRNGRMRTIEADFPDVQVSDRHTTFRQNLDADVNVRSDIDAGARLQDQRATGRANVRGQLNSQLNLPTAETQPQDQDGYYYNSGERWAPRRGWFRRGR